MKTTASWDSIFPFDQPYEQQIDGMERLGEVFDNHGVAVLEGACGTGKTLTSLTPALEQVRNPNSEYERVVCVTSVKQQIEAFENDMKTINENMPAGEEFSGMTVVGKADLCAYTDVGMIENEDIYSDCNTLRDENREDGEWEMDANAWSTTDESQQLSGDGWQSPHKDINPIDEDMGGTNEDAPVGCGFYAQYRARVAGHEDPPNILGAESYMTRDDILQGALNAGMCPHAVMMNDIQHMDIVVANYRHIFDPMTKEIVMDDIIDDRTILVCDEAHGIVDIVRDLYSEGVAYQTLVRSIEEIDSLLNPDSDGEESRAETILARSANAMGISENELRNDLKDLSDIIEYVSEEMKTDITRAMKDEFGSSWKRKMGNKIDMLPDEVKHPYRDPEEIPHDPITYEPQLDRLSQQITSEFDVDFDQLNDVATQLAIALQDETEQDETYADSAARNIMRWVNKDQITYFRMLKMEKRYKHNQDAVHRWDRSYTARLEMYNCIPTEEIKETLNEFGATVLMSATLAPIDAYMEITGVEDMKRDTYIDKMVYGLKFPRENRDSFIVDLPKYTSENRGDTNEMTDTRKDYRETISDFTASVDGNTMICMPSYSEAEWAGKILKFSPDVDKEVLVDESSSNQETEMLKKRFFSGGDKVLLTSQLGTLTEGVDYDGDKLAGCLVVGVPIKPTNEPEQQAIKTAYEDEFGDWNGFAYSLIVPAVQKARQAIGRVIRSDDDVGVRGFADERYGGYISQFLPDYQNNEFEMIDQQDVSGRVETFFKNNQR